MGKQHARWDKPIAEKESQKWLTSLTATADLQKPLPQTRRVSVSDREADGYDLFLGAQALCQDVLVRAAWDRRVAHPEGDLWAYLQHGPLAGRVSVPVPRRLGQPSWQAAWTVR
ncbi:MAG: hypothetical protein NZT92_16285 [Abditibacteriales bacterium]|nr:hypothetical protein [Abditibacteriales bacterium]MDW8367480.1 hypothetical protein [Abditibacteriales bacterium]